MPDDEYTSDRVAVHEALAEHARPAGDDSKGAVLTSWTYVAEWMDAEGARYLTRDRAQGVPAWQVKGMLHEALFGQWEEDW
jgi:hypothetical protein